ncbi:MAG TPA: exo-beta-N-acetylmuramidase NamZ domain-containing protein [Pyrinomonadaceae bacterium]|jgi:uncharacterized protein YbbC (DUF1343 family)
MFERYTEKARRVIFFARYEASQFGAQAIEPEYLLLGLLREDKTLARRFLAGRSDSTLENIRKELEARTPLREKISTSVELGLSAEAKRVLAYAHEESERLQHRHIGTEHLLLGILREEGTLAADVLSERGLQADAVRDEIARFSGDSASIAETSLLTTPGRQWVEEIRYYGKKLINLAERLSAVAPHATHDEADETSDEKVASIQSSAETGDSSSSVERESRSVSARRSGRRTVLGFERLLSERLHLLRGARVALVSNQASVDRSFRHVADLMRENEQIQMSALFGPQHGIRGDVQDNMVETPHTHDAETGLPIYSLYSETREPTERMLEETDVLVFDMQDVGCRIYTFVYTLANCMRAAKRYGKRVVVCDRPNPLGGDVLAGTILEPEYASFVGQFPLPTRHGMTVCELAWMFNEHWGIGCDLEVVPMEGWSREQWFDETDAPWVLPSPNMPTLDAATVFPGTVHLEGTQMSEGRGTTRPFELVGAPYIDAPDYARRLEAQGFEGVRFRAANFLPTFQKHAERVCGGVQLHVTDRTKFESVTVGIALVKLAYDLYGEEFRWKEPPYEYVYDKNPFDVIAGTRSVRDAIEQGISLEEITTSWQQGLERFAQERAPYLLY